MDLKPYRCLFHIILSSLLFSITDTQGVPIIGCFQAELPPNSYRRPRLGSNNGSGDTTLAQRAVLWVVVVQIYKRALRAGA